MSLTLVALSVALAQELDAPAKATVAEPHRTLTYAPKIKATRSPSPDYPPPMMHHGSALTVRCVFSLRVEADGVPSEVLLTDGGFCSAPYETVSRDALLRWRFEPPGEPVAVIKIFSFKVYGANKRIGAEAFERIAAAHEEVPESLPYCRIGVTIHPDGAISGLRTNNRARCLALPDPSPPPRRLTAAAAGEEVRCEWVFKVSDAGPHHFALLSGCSGPHRSWTQRTLESWLWIGPTSGAEVDYRVTVRFATGAP